MKEKEATYSDISHILIYFNANAHDPEQLLEDIKIMEPSFLNETKKNMQSLIKRDVLDSSHFYEATACTARDDRSARQFFKDVYAYAFEYGDEPDLTNYWNR